jgi:hypothetical protein
VEFVNVVRVVPRHVAACRHSPDHRERWAIYVWKRTNRSVQQRIQYCCNSWRCEVCRRHEAAVTFARIRDAIATVPDPSGWCFLVLTLDRDGYYSGQPWLDVTAAYQALGKMTRALLARIGRTWGPETAVERSGRSKQMHTVRKLGNRWVAVVEAHRSGWPHVNLLVWCPELAELLRKQREDRLADPDVANAVSLAQDAWTRREPITPALRATAREAVVLGGELVAMATDSGWGRQSTAEPARDSAAIAGYIVKLAGQHDSSVGELAKITQVPLNAPERFRRLRSGRGFLPPRQSDPSVTGCLVRRREQGERWKGSIHSMNPPKDPEQAAAVIRAARAEIALMREEQRMADHKGRLPAMPPIRFVLRGVLEPHRETSERRSAMRRRAEQSA